MRAYKIAVAYGLLFIALAAADVGSTLLGHATGATEFNPTVASEGRINVGRFVLLNAVMGAGLVGMLAWALANHRHAEPLYMVSPWRAALSWLTYLNPFSARNRPRAVFHWIATAISIVLVRAFAIINNLAIASDVTDILTPIARFISRVAGGDFAYVLTATVIIIPFWIGSLYATPVVLRRLTAAAPALRLQ